MQDLRITWKGLVILQEQSRNLAIYTTCYTYMACTPFGKSSCVPLEIYQCREIQSILAGKNKQLPKMLGVPRLPTLRFSFCSNKVVACFKL